MTPPIATVNPESPVSVYVDRFNRRTYVRTNHAENTRQIVDAMTPYIGRNVWAFYAQHYQLTRLVGISGYRATFHLYRTGNTFECDAFFAFGTNCAVIEPV
jgi:hypothetical protein